MSEKEIRVLAVGKNYAKLEPFQTPDKTVDQVRPASASPNPAASAKKEREVVYMN